MTHAASRRSTLQTIAAALASAAAVWGAASAPAAAQDADPATFGPAVGDTIADVISAPDATGTVRTFAELTGENGVMLNFNRSVDW